MQPQTAPPTFTPSKTRSNGIWIAILAILLIAALAFGFWAFQGRQSYKNDSDKKVASAIATAKLDQAAIDKSNFDKQANQPYKTFQGPATYGSVKISYPKTYSAYVDQSNSSEPINAYFYPGEVPGTGSNVNYALRIELSTSSYSSVLGQYQSQIQSGDIKASAFVPAKLAKASNLQRGVKLSGNFGSNQTGAMIIIPVRNQALKLYTMSNDYLSDFNSIVLPSLTFNP